MNEAAGGEDAGADVGAEQSISSSHSLLKSPDVPPQPQPPPSPFQKQFEHFVVSQSFSIEADQGGEKTEDEELGEGRLSEDEEEEKAKDDEASEAFAHNLNLSSGRLTPDVEEINFENPLDGSAEKENRFEA